MIMLDDVPLVYFIVQVLGILGIILNLISIFKTHENFEINRVIFLLIFLDNVTSLVSCSIIVINGLCLYFGIVNLVTCWNFFLSVYVPSLVGIVFNALIAGMRVATLRKSNKNGILSEQTQRSIVLIACSLTLGLFLVYTSFNFIYDKPQNILVEFCLRGDKGRPTHQQAVFLGTLVMSWCTAALVSDCYILHYVRNHIYQSSVEPKEAKATIIRIPVLATLSSSLLIVPYLGIMFLAVRVANLGIEDTVALMYILTVCMAMVRAPLALNFTFKTFKKDEEQFRKLTKEKRLAWEIHHAYVERQTRTNQVLMEPNDSTYLTNSLSSQDACRDL